LSPLIHAGLPEAFYWSEFKTKESQSILQNKQSAQSNIPSVQLVSCFSKKGWNHR
jgi:hypothetical protein